MNFQKSLIFLTTLCTLFIFTGCGTSQSGRVYSQGQAQRSLSVYYGTIIELREVTIEGSNSGAGAVLGGIAGGVLGSTIGSGRGRTLATVGGALAGLAAGSAIEKGASTKPATEFTIELDNGRMMAVVQESDGYYRVGDRVRLLQAGDGTWRVRQ
ncbi:MAG: glycine zipper 2TM domain-containing protein [Deltaproteobacteria bacterium]|nr:glycine zipper 2TM domain-containing protein [Candidatus Tharpella aukensis]